MPTYSTRLYPQKVSVFLTTCGGGYSDSLQFRDLPLDHFPAFLELRGRPCLLVGAGRVAFRKARLLLDAGAALTVVAPRMGGGIAALVAAGKARHEPRAFQAADVEGRWLVVTATGDAAVDQQVFDAATAARVFCNSVDDVANSSFITPAIVDRAPVTVAISSAGSAPVLARRIRAQIEAILPARLGVLAHLAGGFRQRVKARFRGIRARRKFWEEVFDGPIANAVYAGRDDAAAIALAERIESRSNRSADSGEAWLVGAGPGDPDLLTLRALQVMQAADVIVHDRLVSVEVLQLARRDADLIPVGKTPGCRTNRQEDINELLVNLVRSGKRVCRLKGGDPLIFGRGGEEAEALAAAGLRCGIVPGITAAAGCAAYSGIPLTHRDAAQSVVLLTAHGKDSVDRLDWPSLARDRQTLAVYMGVHRFGIIMDRLVAHGRSRNTPIAIIENGTTPKQRVLYGALGQLPMIARAHAVKPPALLIIGEVARHGHSRILPGHTAYSDTVTLSLEPARTRIAKSQ